MKNCSIAAITVAFLVIILCPVTLCGQGNADTLKLDECLRIAIESNYGVKIARNREQIAANNVTGSEFMPVVTAGTRGSKEFLDLHERYFESPNISREYTSNVFSADVSLSWRLFDGLAMFASHDTKRELLRVGELNLKQSMEGLVADVSDQYFSIVTLRNRLEAAYTYLSISTTRYSQAEEKYLIGALSGLELAQARINFNADSSAVVLQEQVLRNAYITLYEMMNVPLDSHFIIGEPVAPAGNLHLENLLQSAYNNNTSILLARSGQKVAEFDLRVARASRYPTLDFTSGYRFNHSGGSSASVRFNRVHGPSVGLTLSSKIFGGFDTRRRVRNAVIELDNSELLCRSTELGVESAITQTYNVYRKNMTMIDFESESADIAYKNLEAAMEMYRLGSMSGTDFREIQRSYLEAVNRKLDAMYQAKSSEIELLYLSGQIF